MSVKSQMSVKIFYEPILFSDRTFQRFENGASLELTLQELCLSILLIRIKDQVRTKLVKLSFYF